MKRPLTSRSRVFHFSLFWREARIFLALSIAALAQQPAAKAPLPPSAYKLIAVKVTGSKRFTSEDVAAASGLPLGTIAHEEDFKKAARQLGESGAFSAVAYTFSYTSAGTKLEFQVTDADKFVPARFTDFVWFSDDVLQRKLHEHIPLFKGELPISGRLPDQVSDVLQALLVELGVPGNVEYVRNERRDNDRKDKENDRRENDRREYDRKDHAAGKAPATSDPFKNDGPEGSAELRSIDYRVTGVSVRIQHAEFPGAGPAELPLLQAAAQKLTDREYSREYMSSFAEHTLLPLYHERGYLKAECARPEPTVVKGPAPEPGENKPPSTFVEVTFPVTPGLQYKLAGSEWSGNKEIPSETLQSLLHGKVGQPANTLQLEDNLRAAQELYGSRGYVTTTIKVIAQFDDAASTVTFHLEVNEGALYHMGELQFRGIDNTLTARLLAAWKLRPGDVYDANYLKEFLPKAKKLLPVGLDWEESTHVTALARDKTVDVDVQYTAIAPK
jgi:outer membrane protein insertion porin family